MKSLIRLDRLTLLIVLTTSIVCCYFFGFSRVFVHYYGPILVMQYYLVAITKLQHHHEEVEWCYDSDWQKEIGIENTFDREFGFANCLGKVFHHLTDSHVVHHLSSSIPHYYAKNNTSSQRNAWFFVR